MTQAQPNPGTDQFRNSQHTNGTVEYVVLQRTGDGPWLQTGGDPFTSPDRAAQYAADLAQGTAERATRYAQHAKNARDYSHPKDAKVYQDLATEARTTEFDIFVRETLPLRRLTQR